MNKQPKLIDADKLLKWMKNSYEEKSQEPYEIGKNHMATMIENLISNGYFNPDHITIKTGDRVVITDAMNPDFIGTKAIVKKISKSSPYSAKLKEIAGDWPLSSLEVSHDRG